MCVCVYIYIYIYREREIYKHIHHIFLIHLSADGHLGCFHALAVINSAPIRIVVHVSFWIIVLSGYMSRSGVVGSYEENFKTVKNNFNHLPPIWLNMLGKEFILYSLKIELCHKIIVIWRGQPKKCNKRIAEVCQAVN